MKFRVVFLVFVVFLSGCAQKSNPVVFSKMEIADSLYTDSFQYSAPWNEDLYEQAYFRSKEILPELNNPIKGGIVASDGFFTDGVKAGLKKMILI